MDTLNIDHCTLQEACDFAVRKIVEQNYRCVQQDDITGKVECMYSDDEGGHCAIGWLLPEETLKQLNGYVGDVGMMMAEDVELPEIIRENTGAFMKLQEFHDWEDFSMRQDVMNRLRDSYHIDTSGEHWQQWLAKATPIPAQE